MPYTPPQEVLERYARVLVDFALGGGEGIKPGEVVRIASPECARALYVELNRAVWRSGGHVLGAYQPDEDGGANLQRDFFELARRRAARVLPGPLHARPGGRNGPPGVGDRDDRPARPGRGRSGPHHAPRRDAAPAAGLARGEGERGALHVDARPLRDRRRWRPRRDSSWSSTGSRSSTPAFWTARTRSARWREIGERLDVTRERLDALQIERVHVTGEDVDLHVQLGESRRWLGGSGPQHPQLRDLHQPGLARHRGLDPLRPAAVPLRQPRPRNPPEVRETGASPRPARTRTSAC